MSVYTVHGNCGFVVIQVKGKACTFIFSLMIFNAVRKPVIADSGFGKEEFHDPAERCVVNACTDVASPAAAVFVERDGRCAGIEIIGVTSEDFESGRVCEVSAQDFSVITDNGAACDVDMIAV